MDINIRDFGPAHLIAALGKELGIVDSINETVQWDEKLCFIDLGTHTLIEVTVKDHRITETKLDHRHGQGEAAEVITDHVIEVQSLQVDTISGITSSSKVILKAIEKALLLNATESQV